MSKPVGQIRMTRPLHSMVTIDPESLSGGTPPDFHFRYIDIAAAADGRLRIPDTEISYRDAPSRARRKIRHGDVLMSTVRPNLRAFAYCDLPPGDYVASTGFAVLRANEPNDPRFILYSILSDSVAKQIESHAVGSNYPAINSSDVKRLEITAFEPPQQRRIAEILGAVDEAIEATEALIAKQQQVKAGLMHDLFTRGLTPDGKLRPPRSEAPDLYRQTPLGWLPKEWVMKSMRQVAIYQHGQPFPSAEYSDEGVLLLRPGNLHTNGFVRFDAAQTTRLPHIWRHRCPSLVLKRDDIVMNLTAQSLEDQFHGRVCLVTSNEPALLNQRIARFSAIGIRHRYLYWLLRSPQFRIQIERTTQGTKVQHIYNSDLDRAEFGVPQDVSEQEAIEDSLQSIADVLLVEEARLAKLRQQKQGLMQVLLTPPA